MVPFYNSPRDARLAGGTSQGDGVGSPNSCVRLSRTLRTTTNIPDTSHMASSPADPPSLEREPSPETSSLKRRRSEEEVQDSKKQRTSPGKRSPSPAEEAKPVETVAPKDVPVPASEPSQTAMTEAQETRRKRSVATEKQRNKRLFGALLGNLNQPSDRVAKRRAEIEQRRKAELQKQDDERLEDRQRRLKQLAEHRKREQERVDEETMRVRHSDLLDKAHFLQTNAEPRLYYRPWDLLPHQEDIIDDQVRDARLQIDEELAALERQKQSREKQDHEDEVVPDVNDRMADHPDGVSGEVAIESAHDGKDLSDTVDTDKQVLSDTDVAATGGEDTSGDRVAAEPGSTEIDKVPAASLESGDTEEAKEPRKDEWEDDGDHVVEGDEDTVIY